MKEYFVKNIDNALTLCRIDAKIGDRVKFKDVSVEVDISMSEKNWYWLFQYAPYTKIGVVSEKAKWVKEGMIFDDTELLAQPAAASIKREIKDWTPMHLINTTVFVKCPGCGNFR